MKTYPTRDAVQPLAEREWASPQGSVSNAFVARNEWSQASATIEVKTSDSALRAHFHATQKVSHPAHEVTETRQSIPESPSVQLVVATNTEALSPAAPRAIATASTPVAHSAIAATSTPTAPKAIAAIPAPTAPTKPTVQPSTPAPAVTEYVLNGSDNLYSVSRRLQVSFSDLLQANGISNPRQLRVGQKLKVPERKSDIYFQETFPPPLRLDHLPNASQPGRHQPLEASSDAANGLHE